MKNAARLLINKLPNLKANFAKLTANDVLVGVPAETTGRKDDDPISNATIAYLMDKGSPANNIPARPFMEPGIADAKDKIVGFFKTAAKKALDKDDGAIERGLDKAGLAAQASIRNKINSGIPPALSDKTLAARRKRGRTGEVPLVDTGQLRNSINYVIRKKSSGTP